ncbi:MAG TPA: hypothetical protein PKK05_20990, partial [Leptospiraceae bacterium]|nr:hypothetical protein [Leptospiraceae bacterium]
RIRAVPPELSGMRKLLYLNLEYNRIEEIPKEICSMNHLLELYLEGNLLKTVPKEIENMTGLYALAIFKKNPLEHLPKEFYNLNIFHEFNWDSTGQEFEPSSSPWDRKIIDDAYKRIKECGRKKNSSLVLTDRRLFAVPSEICHMTHLKELDLSGNFLRFLCSDLENLENLEVLRLNRLNYLGRISCDFTKFRKLKTLELIGTSVSGKEKERLKNWSAKSGCSVKFK